MWPFAVRAQQPAMPVIGFLSVTFAGEQPHWLVAFRNGLGETGYVEGHNVSFVYRWAEGQYNRLPELAADLVRHHRLCDLGKRQLGTRYANNADTTLTQF